MTFIVFAIIFVVPLLVLMAVAKAVDEDSPWRLRDATLFSIGLLAIAVVAFTIIEVYVN
jgi:hypothetical protein